MLKLTYIDNDFHLEHLTQLLEEWVALRVILAVRVSEKICIEPSTASFLLPADLPRLQSLETEDEFTVCSCDSEYIEVCLEGTWLASNTNEEGIFVTTLSYTSEVLLFHLWQEAQLGATVTGE